MGYNQTLKTQKAVGTNQANYTAAKSVINAEALFDWGRNQLAIGDIIVVKVRGSISNIVTTPGLMNFQVKMGSVVAYDSGNIQLNATAHTNLPFEAEIELELRAAGPGATAAQFQGHGTFQGVMFTRTAAQVDGVNSETTIQGPATAPALGTAFDSTVVNTQDLWVGFTIANAGNNITITHYRIELHSDRN